jgi:hypothetical protein
MPTVYPIQVYSGKSIVAWPHMARRDAAIWTRFLDRYADDYIGFSYDVAMGGRILDLPDHDPQTALGWQYSTALKLDAVGWKGNQVWIFEVRPEATVGTYGAAVVYTMVAKREQLAELPLVPAIVCETCQIDVEWACNVSGVQLIKV